ncbi:hypothetical protein RUMLAC_02702 [[Ruminococcus] lactaris ATCC 29176]|uniref:Uncharacterized protein n=1 Tax=[Ruminococcus] lactaris ATCC 29176 TaxID=471875 RepID=B5CT79_9FIRM|nr:hypothetical protein RUMLAC_02702 [[Ruminococcus] lactaris ATCC 29176]
MRYCGKVCHIVQVFTVAWLFLLIKYWNSTKADNCLQNQYMYEE